MLWCSIDPANKSGIAYWDNDRLVSTTVLRKVGAKGKYANCEKVYGCKFNAWCETIIGCKVVVIEEGFGKFATAIKSQAGLRGYIEAICDYQKRTNAEAYRFTLVNVKEWRRCIKEAFGISWPATTERKKALSVKLVKDNYGIAVTDDEADAVLLGVAAMRMGMVEFGKETK